MTVFRAATLRTFFFAFHAGAKELSFMFLHILKKLLKNPRSLSKKTQNPIKVHKTQDLGAKPHAWQHCLQMSFPRVWPLCGIVADWSVLDCFWSEITVAREAFALHVYKRSLTSPSSCGRIDFSLHSVVS